MFIQLYKVSTGQVATVIKDAIQRVYNKKSKKKRWLKVAEECGELNVAIIQHFTKKGERLQVLEEIVDVTLQLELIYRDFTREEIDAMFDKKSDKFMKHKDTQVTNKILA